MQFNTEINLSDVIDASTSSFAIGYWFDEQNNIHFSTKQDIVSELHAMQISSFLPKEKNATFCMQHNQKSLFFFYYNSKKSVPNISNALKDLPKHFTKINVLIDSLGFDQQTILNLSVALFDGRRASWSAKKEKAVRSSCSFNFVIDNPTNSSESANVNTSESAQIINKRASIIETAKSIHMAQYYTKQLIDMPPNIITPEGFCEQVQKAINDEQLANKIFINIIHKQQLQELQMGALLGVAQGSANDPKLLVLEYKNAPNPNDAPVVFVGKGVTFDSGGINIKPSASLDTMKCDMAGAASAVGALLFAAKNNLPLNVIAIAACVENMPSGSALKPGDVIFASNGTSIEVIDTDAEGRLVLADALLFAAKFNPQITIDLATLTGAAVVALGSFHSAVFTKDSTLATSLIEAGKQSNDMAWQLPLDDEHEVMLESKVADIANLAQARGAGAQNGAIFLKRFAPANTPWAHIDIAGTSFQKATGATGRPVPLLCNFLINLCNKN